MQLHQPTLTPTLRALHEKHKRVKADIAAASYERKLAAVDEAMREPEWPAPAPYPPRQWFFIEYELPTQYPPVSKIQKIVAQHFKLTHHDLLSKRRTKETIIPRHVAMYLSKELTPRSTVDIGRRFNRDHTVVIFAIRKITALVERDADFANEVQAIRERLSA